MAIIGCDWHARYQPIAMLDFSDGEIVARRLSMKREKREPFTLACPSRR